jgi:hypothetical protein
MWIYSYFASQFPVEEGYSLHVMKSANTSDQFSVVYSAALPDYKIIRLWPPPWSSGQSSWLQVQSSGFVSQRYQIF